MIDFSVQDLDYSINRKREQPLKVLKHLSFEIKKGEFTVILGESGCGKSTILQLLAGLLHPTSGKILINGEPLTGQDPSISLLFQGSTLLPWLNVTDNIRFGCQIRKDLKDLPKRVDHYIRMMSLEKYRNFHPQQLSVGLSKRVDLARSLIGNPRALLLDEPFAPLDYYTKKRLQHELLAIWDEIRMTCVYVTHDVEEALQLGQTILIMDNDPGTIAYQMRVPLSYPREIVDKQFVQMKKELLNQFGLTYNKLSVNDNE